MVEKWSYICTLWSICCCLVTQSCLTFFEPIYCCTPDFPVLHHLQEFAQTHVHWVDDAIQPFHLLLPPSPPALNLFQHQLALHIRWPKYWNIGFSINPSNEYLGWFPLGLTGLTTLLSNKLSRVFSSAIVWKHQFFSAQPVLWFKSHILT